MKTNKEAENRAYKVTLVVLLGLAAFTTAMKDLQSLQGMVSGFHQLTTQWHGTDLLARNEGPSLPTSESCPDSPAPVNSVTVSDSSDCIAAATDGYVDMNYQNIPEPEVGATVDWSAGPKTNPEAVRLARGIRNSSQLARSGSAPSTRLNEEIASIQRVHDLPARFEFKTMDSSVTFQVPLAMIADLKADAVDHDVSPEFVLGLLGKIDRKQSRGKAETRRRELMIKRFEGNISSRRAS